MQSRKACLAVAAAAFGTSAACASASLVPLFVRVPVDPGALADDPSLANYDVYDLQVNISAGDRFTTADLHAPLSNGTYYIPPANDANKVASAAARNTVGLRYLRDDTFVCTPLFDSEHTSILGRSTLAPTSQIGEVFPSNGSNFEDSSDPNGTTFLPANSMMLVDVAWDDFNANMRSYPTPANYTIARLTVLKGSTGTASGRVLGLQQIGVPISFSFVIPEPSAVTLFAAAIGAIALQRRRSGRPLPVLPE